MAGSESMAVGLADAEWPVAGTESTLHPFWTKNAVVQKSEDWFAADKGCEVDVSEF